MLAETISLQDLISEANAQLVDDSIEGEEKAEPETPSDTPGDTPGETPLDPTTHDDTPPPLPTITARVLSSPDSYTAFGTAPINDPASHGILGGGNMAERLDRTRTTSSGRSTSTTAASSAP